MIYILLVHTKMILYKYNIDHSNMEIIDTIILEKLYLNSKYRSNLSKGVWFVSAFDSDVSMYKSLHSHFGVNLLTNKVGSGVYEILSDT